MGVEWLRGLPRGLGGVGKPSWGTRRRWEVHEEGREGSGLVNRSTHRVVRDREDFRRARRGREAILEGQEGSRGPPRGAGGARRPFWRAASHREDPVEGL